ncbi:uncharacterized protein [Palaemon carinicauda]|uniref:uncharacterized protein n=1 Tax=Palaemon carinicauda TaxID=392227 RepID=UPI0035B5DB1D
MWQVARWAASLMLLMAASMAQKVSSKDYLPDIPSLERLDEELGNFKLETMEDLDAYGEAIRRLAKLHISKAFSAEVRRYKRELDSKSANVTNLEILPFNLTEKDGSSWIHKVTGFEVLLHEGRTFIITGGPTSENVAVMAINPYDGGFDIIAKFKLSVVAFEKINIITAAVDNELLWIALGSSDSRLVSIVCVNLLTGEVRQPQNIPIKGILGDLHMFQAGDTVYLVIGERYRSAPSDSVGTTEIYMLMGRYFDRRDRFSMECTGVQSITGFLEGGDYIIIIGMNNVKGTHVYELDPIADTLTLVQELIETRVLQVVTYIDAHDLKNYVIVRSESSRATIYWWDNSQLVQWQVLHTGLLSPFASVGFITLRNLETVVFVAERGVITVYVDDLTGHYFETFSVATSCSSVVDIRGIIISETYYIYYICVNDVNVLERRVLTFLEVDFGAAEGHGDTLLECLHGLNRTLEGRKQSIAYLEDIVVNDRLMTVDHDQVWSGPIVFTELTVTGTAEFTNTINIVNINLPDSTSPSLAEIEATTGNLEAEIASLQGALSMVLNFDGNQTINGPIDASSLVTDNLEIDYLRIGSLNGVELKELTSTFLINGIDQEISGRWKVGYLSTGTLNTRLQQPPGRINGYLTSELMRRSIPDQVVTGNHSYNTVVVREICNNLCNGFSVDINGIDTSTIVTQGSDVTFIDKKIFTNLRVNGEVTAGLVNGVDISELESRVILKNDPGLQNLDGQYTFDRVEVRGNVDAATINGVDFRKLDDSAVKTTGDYRIAGDLIYNTDLTISGSLISDTINGILWSDVVDLNSPALITGMYFFKEATILGSLISNDVNGLDFSQDVALLDKDQTISGRITFTQSVEVTGPNGVIMENGGTVNGIDPSSLAFRQTNLDKIVISGEVTLSGPLDITGDINVKSINGLLLNGIEERYWIKSRDQVISNAVQLNNVVFNGPVTASTLNGRKLSDYLHNFGNEIITGSFTFLGNVEVQGNIVLDPGKTVDGIDVSEFVKKVVTLTGQQTITGQKTFEGKVTIIGDLDLGGKLNGIDLSKDLLRLDQTIPHKGHLTFVSKTTVTELEIVNGDLVVDTLNGLDVAAAAADLVLFDEDAIITGGYGLQFTGQVKVNELYVSGDVDGININELQSRALLKNSAVPQVIDGRLLVDQNLQFLGGLSLESVNGKNWTEHLNNVVTLDYSGLVNGRKIFTQGIDVIGDFNPSTINGVDIALLASRILRRSGEQLISAYYTFNKDINAKALFAPVIDGVDMASVLLTDVGGIVSGTVTFTEDLVLLNGLESDHYVLDGCNVVELNSGGVVTDNDKVVLSSDVTVGRLIIRGNVISTAGIFAGSLNFNRFLDNLVLKSSNQVITAPMQFGEVTIDKLTVNSINGIDIGELLKQAARMDQENVINCDVRFTNGLRVGTLRVRSSVSGRGGGGVLVNGLDLSEIARRAVLKTGGTVLISGVKSFSNGFIVDNLVVAGSLGGVPVSNLVALSRTDVLANNLRFIAPITVRGDLQVTGLVDGVDLEEFILNRLTLNSTQTMFTSCTFENIRIEGDLDIDKINDVLIADLVIRSAASQTITGKKEFLGGLHVNGNLNVKFINGIDINALNRSIVRTDVDTVINYQVTFTSVVTSNVDVFVDGTVNGFDLSELNTNNLSDLLIRQYLRIEEIRSQFGSITVENYQSAREMFAALSYLERIKLPKDTNVTGSLWVGRIPEVGPGLYLKITSCPAPVGRQCGCNAECYYYEVNDSAGLEPYIKLGYKVNILGHALSTNLYIAIYSGCFEGVPGAQVRVVYADGSNGFVQRLDLGLVADSGLFLVNGKSYIVTVSQFLDESNREEKTSINVVTPVLGSRIIAVVWNRTTTRSAVDLDLLQIGSTWYLLVTNNYDAENYVDPYSAKSELYVWNSYSQEFVLRGEYMADHATSGMFISIAKPVEEYFFSLTQYKSAKFSVYDDNMDYTANVLIYRYNKVNEEFEAFQYLNVFGVMAQTILRVDNNYYLLLVSTKFNSLYVYQYYHNEGFVQHSKLRVNSPRSVAVLRVRSGVYVAVTTPDGLQRFRVKTKGLDPDNLSFYTI